MRSLRAFVPLLSVYALAAAPPELKTASSHPMQYYLSLPEGWTSAKKWPVVVVIESANRQFQANAEVFEKARGSLPFILVAPLAITNGGPSYRQVPTYHYSDAVWNEIERVGRCRFDMTGIAAVVNDVERLYSGEDKYFVTGWEAAGHTIWAMLFTHPETLRAVALSTPNYQGRCISEGQFSSVPERVDLPVAVFAGSADAAWRPNQPLFAQTEEATRIAKEHGYRNITESTAPGKGHGPLADETLAYFSSLLKR